MNEYRGKHSKNAFRSYAKKLVGSASQRGALTCVPTLHYALPLLPLYVYTRTCNRSKTDNSLIGSTAPLCWLKPPPAAHVGAVVSSTPPRPVPGLLSRRLVVAFERPPSCPSAATDKGGRRGGGVGGGIAHAISPLYYLLRFSR